MNECFLAVDDHEQFVAGLVAVARVEVMLQRHRPLGGAHYVDLALLSATENTAIQYTCELYDKTWVHYVLIQTILYRALMIIIQIVRTWVHSKH